MLLKRRRIALAHDLPTVVDSLGSAEVDPASQGSAQGPEIAHLAVLPQEGVRETRCRTAVAHDLPAVVDIQGIAPASARQRPEVGYLALLPEAGVQLTRRRLALAHDLPKVVDA